MKKILLSFIIINYIFLTGCSNHSVNQLDHGAVSTDVIRNHIPRVKIPSPDGLKTLECDVATLDISHTDQGYCMISYFGKCDKVKMQLTTPDEITYTYTLHGDFETFPLTGGDGTYRVAIYENITGDQYVTILSHDFTITLENEFNTYLYPNQYVNFNSKSNALKLGEELASTAHSDLDVVTNVYNYLSKNITYDIQKSKTVKSGYLPQVDQILETKKGICFDYAAVMATLLRSQGIPTRLEVGYTKNAYHAWVSVYLKEVGWVNGIVSFNGDDWELMDPTLAASKSEKKLKNFIEDSSNYITKYVY